MPQPRKRARPPYRARNRRHLTGLRWGWATLLVLGVIAGALVWRARPAGDRPQTAAPPSVTSSSADPSLRRGSTQPRTTGINVFFTQYEPATGVIRLVAQPRQIGPEGATAGADSAGGPSLKTLQAALDALLAGPSPDEKRQGLGTEIPGGTRLRQLRVKDGTAFVDLTGAFEEGGGSTSVQARLAQVVYTATQFPELAQQVQFSIDGQAREWISGEGVLIDHPFSRRDIPDFF